MIKRFQALLQWVFLRVEGLFNAAFGDRINPFYHLGAITFFLFWVVGASGLYLYIFFETGLSVAYSSVVALTENQWFAGGIMRSVHRYASDAMVLTMVLHMLRYFAFNLYHGFRWFSWIAGVMLIWMVYATGINGYMLPWDQLAQFVTVTSFEWLDWLPSFGGTLMRNFIYSSAVGDRFFTLLSFMHLGLPLVVLMVMWIHVQRVPKARTTPPRPIVIGLLLTMLVLSLVLPVHSQGGISNLAQAVTSVELDWFYLAIFPLLTEWPLGRVHLRRRDSLAVEPVPVRAARLRDAGRAAESRGAPSARSRRTAGGVRVPRARSRARGHRDDTARVPARPGGPRREDVQRCGRSLLVAPQTKTPGLVQEDQARRFRSRRPSRALRDRSQAETTLPR